VDVSPSATVRAAGGIVHRVGDDGAPEILLVHRPRYDDWSLPKGKADPGEGDEDTALREVEEETGLRCVLGARAGETRYRDSKGRSKVVQYWLMEPPPDGAHPFVPNSEVDELRWCTVDDATQLLSYEHDRELLQQAPVPG
jgi:8-oxo-dGTP pyrophosphatase MutT (NUDIX family)